MFDEWILITLGIPAYDELMSKTVRKSDEWWRLSRACFNINSTEHKYGDDFISDCIVELRLDVNSPAHYSPSWIIDKMKCAKRILVFYIIFYEIFFY